MKSSLHMFVTITGLILFNILSCFLFCVLCVFVLFCVFYLLLCCPFPTFVQDYQPLSPSGNAITVNEYHITSYHLLKNA